VPVCWQLRTPSLTPTTTTRVEADHARDRIHIRRKQHLRLRAASRVHAEQIADYMRQGLRRDRFIAARYRGFRQPFRKEIPMIMAVVGAASNNGEVRVL
jgi:hypothetical protein